MVRMALTPGRATCWCSYSMENYFCPKRACEVQIESSCYYTAELPPPVAAIRYYLPLEILVAQACSGKYHYCCYVYPANQISPVGYCAEGCPGHPSKEQA